jgi:hypothetical protein
MNANKHQRHPGQGYHRRVRRVPVPRLLKILDEIETEIAAAHGVLPHPVCLLRADLARLVD